ncbi:dynactin subunit 1-like [Gossypium australe]|uniref:Dynactin subunit 1-like n=1 Tax=Gossypium australe TaxID=47621 RepID=A0A5B6X1I9_9ROSI|nr:dynactin subunit 1-like [Gossypium australe]
MNESFRQYAQRWRKVATQVQPPLLEKKTTMLFISTLKAPFINHMLGSATKSSFDIVMSGEMIENTIRCGKIEAGEGTKRSAPRKRENEVNNTRHSIENCTAFKKVVEKIIKMGIGKFDDPPVPNVAGNLLPNHTDQ